MKKILNAKNIHKKYSTKSKAIEVLKGVDIELEKGSFSVIMGPSGSGKSTLMHILAGLLEADRGEVTISDHKISEMKDKALTLFRRHNVGLIYQDYNLIPTLTAEENITLPIMLDGKNSDKTKLEKIFNVLGLQNRAKHRPSELSGGECQRVAIGRALITDPDIIFADEPTGNLDSISSKSLCELLQTINKENGATILMITHDSAVAAYAKNIYILKDGVIIKNFENNDIGSQMKIYEQYVSFFGEN